MSIAATITRLRDEKGWSKSELARNMGVTRGAVGQWESGVTVPRLENLVKLAALFGVPLSEVADVQNSAASIDELLSALPEADQENLKILFLAQIKAFLDRQPPAKT